MRRSPAVALALALVLAVSAAPLAARQKPADPVAAFDALAERLRGEWQVPGLAVALVRDGKVALAKGYGLRETGKSDAVDGDTLFAVGSTTKAMTVAALGMLVDEGKVAWDDPVRKFIPELELKDGELARELTVRDLLTHRSGMPATDYLWYSGELSWKEIVAHLARVDRASPPRTRFEYQNVMYGLAGEVVARASGQSWAEFVRARIFAPLGMTRTVALGADLAARADVATPHSREDGPLPARFTWALVDPIPSAGAVWSSANDMARWISFLLAPESVKTPSGAPLLAPTTFAEIFRPQFVIQPDGFYPTAAKTRPHWTTYGLGWFQQDYRGREVDFHTGSIDGMSAIVGLAREEKCGVVVLANLDHAELRHVLLWSAMDLAFGGPARDWDAELKPVYDEQRRKAAEAREELHRQRVAGTRPSLALAAYAGTYADPLYGSLAVAVEGDGLRVTSGTVLDGKAEAWHFDTFRVTWTLQLQGESFATFAIGPEGKVTSVDLDGTRFARQETAKSDGD